MEHTVYGIVTASAYEILSSFLSRGAQDDGSSRSGPRGGAAIHKRRNGRSAASDGRSPHRAATKRATRRRFRCDNASRGQRRRQERVTAIPGESNPGAGSFCKGRIAGLQHVDRRDQENQARADEENHRGPVRADGASPDPGSASNSRMAVVVSNPPHVIKIGMRVWRR